jgi:hypothetical protein
MKGEFGIMRKKFIILTSVFVFLLVACLAFYGCANKAKDQKQTFKALLEANLAKDIAISMWDPEKSKAVITTFTVAEVNVDYLVVKVQGEIEKKIVIPFSNLSCFVTTETPPVLVLNDQIMLTGFGETIDNLGYVGNRLERIGRVPKAEQ